MSACTICDQPLEQCLCKDVCENYHGGNPQSRKAHKKLVSTGHKRGQKLAIVSYLVRNDCGLTSDEAAELGICSWKSATARFADLKRDGYIRESGETRPTGSGVDAAVCVATEAGKAFVAERD